MIIKAKSFIFIVITLFALSGCSYIHKHSATKNKANQICDNLKQDIIQNSVHNAPDDYGQNPTKTAQFYKAYRDYNCEHRIEAKQQKL